MSVFKVILLWFCFIGDMYLAIDVIDKWYYNRRKWFYAIEYILMIVSGMGILSAIMTIMISGTMR